jgi:hypothetical protein
VTGTGIRRVEIVVSSNLDPKNVERDMRAAFERAHDSPARTPLPVYKRRLHDDSMGRLLALLGIAWLIVFAIGMWLSAVWERSAGPGSCDMHCAEAER